jgi:hypothetical protein
VLAIFLVIIVCLINLSIGNDKSTLWSSMLSGAVGYILPAPKDDSLLSNSSIEQLQEVLSRQYNDKIHNTSANGSGAIGRLGSGSSGNDVYANVVHDSEK